jgi:outer membrane lipoprotein LolB
VSAPSQFFSAAFELQGNAEQGELSLLTPIGSTAAAIFWTPESAWLQSRGEKRRFPDISALIGDVLGTPVPIGALFAWLHANPSKVDGWEVNLSQFDSGKIVARRSSPAPAAEIRIVLEK